MPLELSHKLKATHGRDAQARQDFISSLRGYILNDMASGMKARFDDVLAPSFARAHERQPATQDEVHDLTAARVAAQAAPPRHAPRTRGAALRAAVSLGGASLSSCGLEVSHEASPPARGKAL